MQILFKDVASKTMYAYSARWIKYIKNNHAIL